MPKVQGPRSKAPAMEDIARCTNYGWLDCNYEQSLWTRSAGKCNCYSIFDISRRKTAPKGVWEVGSVLSMVTYEYSLSLSICQDQLSVSSRGGFGWYEGGVIKIHDRL